MIFSFIFSDLIIFNYNIHLFFFFILFVTILFFESNKNIFTIGIYIIYIYMKCSNILFHENNDSETKKKEEVTNKKQH